MSLLKRFLIGVVLIVIVAFAAKEVFYQKKQSTTVKQQGQEFYYYPKINTYYDVAANSFYYSLDGGETWLIKKPTTPDAPTTLGEKVVFYSESPEVWKDNALHLSEYSGVVVNYKKQDSLFKMATIKDSLEKQKRVDSQTVAEEPQVKGKFLKKLRQKIKKRWQEKEKQ